MLASLAAAGMPAQAEPDCVAAVLVCRDTRADGESICVAQSGTSRIACSGYDSGGDACTGVFTNQQGTYGVFGCSGSGETCVESKQGAVCGLPYVPVPYLGCFLDSTPQVATSPPHASWCGFGV